MKVAQILSTIPDALPREYAQELAHLQSNAPEMGWPFVKRRMASELGADWQGRFASFHHQASAAASLGQVHRAVGLDGRDLACKLQYPDMASAVEADLAQLDMVLALQKRIEPAIDAREAAQEIAAKLPDPQTRAEILKHADDPKPVPHAPPPRASHRPRHRTASSRAPTDWHTARISARHSRFSRAPGRGHGAS